MDTGNPTIEKKAADTSLFWAVPNVAVILFIVAMALFLWFLARQELEDRRKQLIEDILWQEQTIRLQLQSNLESLEVFGRDISLGLVRPESLRARASVLMNNSPELIGVAWVEETGRIGWSSAPATAGRRSGDKLFETRAQAALQRAQETGRPAYTDAYPVSREDFRFEVFVPVFRERAFIGAVTGVYSLQGLLQQRTPWWFAQRYQLSILDEEGHVLAAKLGATPEGEALFYELSLDPPGHGLVLRATSYRTDSNLAQNKWLSLIVGLSLLIVWSLWMLRRHMGRRAKAEEALRAEYAFRKAMEDSLVTGIRAIDLEGRTTYVNPAFCEMVGFPAEELVGLKPPMPYWPPEEMEHCWEVLNQNRSGQAPRTGVEVRFMRRNGERFDVLQFGSPLLDRHGNQTGWLVAINDITERKRAREALKASQERFVAVLDGLDAAVSVANVETRELLYVNEYYRKVFGLAVSDERFCPLPIFRGGGQETGEVLDQEVQSARDGRWYHVKGRVLKWVDGRAVRMEVATDITSLREAEELSRQQQEKLQFTSRLVTMGEMASTLAHELNQPLSAIASYNTGCLNKLKSGRFTPEELALALEKVGAQARRAGKIIRSVREFVKKSEPRRAPCSVNEVVQEALSFLELEARRKSVEITLRLDGALPPVHGDRVMLEQVILNLAKNGIEAMESVPAAERRLLVSTRRSGNQAQVCVRDRGAGLMGKTQEDLFAPFYSTKAEGMGMGLSICRTIVESHQGRLWVESLPEGGSVFCFTLPVYEEGGRRKNEG